MNKRIIKLFLLLQHVSNQNSIIKSGMFLKSCTLGSNWDKHNYDTFRRIQFVFLQLNQS